MKTVFQRHVVGFFVGLQYVTEFQKADSTARPSYVCNLCESKCDMNTVLSHATGFKHRLNYFVRIHALRSLILSRWTLFSE